MNENGRRRGDVVKGDWAGMVVNVKRKYELISLTPKK